MGFLRAAYCHDSICVLPSTAADAASSAVLASAEIANAETASAAAVITRLVAGLWADPTVTVIVSGLLLLIVCVCACCSKETPCAHPPGYHRRAAAKRVRALNSVGFTFGARPSEYVGVPGTDHTTTRSDSE